MIARIWHGYTNPENADIYENLLKEEIFITIKDKNIKGYKGIKLLRRNVEDEVEFITIMTFESIESVKEFVGEDYEKSFVPESARKVLKRFDTRSSHYEIRDTINY